VPRGPALAGGRALLGLAGAGQPTYCTSRVLVQQQAGLEAAPVRGSTSHSHEAASHMAQEAHPGWCATVQAKRCRRDVVARTSHPLTGSEHAAHRAPPSPALLTSQTAMAGDVPSARARADHFHAASRRGGVHKVHSGLQYRAQPAIRPADATRCARQPRRRPDAIRLDAQGARPTIRAHQHRRTPPCEHRHSTIARAPQRSFAARILLFCSVVLAACPVAGATASASLLPVGNGGNCLGRPWIFAAGCSVFTSDEIPSITVGLFDKEGNPCCGDVVTTVEVSLLQARDGIAIPMTGFLVRDSSVSGEPQSAMTLEFSGLRTKSAVAGAFNLTFTAFYGGAPLEYRAAIRILPDTLSLQPEFGEGRKFAVHDAIPAITLMMTGRNATITEGLGLRVSVRLFNKGDMADISRPSLLGTTSSAFDSSGAVVFTDLRVQRTAGDGFRFAFFLEDSDRLCVSGMQNLQCRAQEEHRGLVGGLGGYWIEILGPEFKVLPDRLVVSSSMLSFDNIVRVDASMPLYTVSLYDSKFPDDVLAGINAEDGLEVNVTLVSQSEAYPVMHRHLEGATRGGIHGGVASFKDLVVRSTSGPAFRLLFTASWNDWCTLDNRDPSCAGKCCVFTSNFAVYPYAMRVSPAVVPDMISGDNIRYR